MRLQECIIPGVYCPICLLPHIHLKSLPALAHLSPQRCRGLSNIGHFCHAWPDHLHQNSAHIVVIVDMVRSAAKDSAPRLRIVVLAPTEEAVPPRGYGGSETMVYNLTEELVRRGHEVYLIATGNSTTSAVLVPIAEKSFRETYAPDLRTPAQYAALREYWNVKTAVEATTVIRSLKPDIVHNHVDWLGVLLQNLMPCPMITTVHNGEASESRNLAMAHHPQCNFVSISNNQRKFLQNVNWAATIYNGVNVDAFEKGNGDGNYFAFLGRICPEKGIAEICRMISSSKYRLKIAAKIDKVDTEYYEKEVKPLIDGEQIEYVGEIGFDAKKSLLKDATALLLWLNWEEPFGLVVTEANSCGTPVIVNRRGSMSEIIHPGVNGILVDRIDEMKDALEDVGKIDRSACRAYVEGRFTIKQMTDGYERLARRVVGSSFLEDTY